MSADREDRATRGRDGPVTALLRRAWRSDRRSLWVLAACSLVLVRFYFAPGGVSWAGDWSSHLTYAALASRAIGSGELPIWTNLFACGSPFLQFYGFLFYYVVALLDLVLGDLDRSVKVVLAAGHVASGLTMFAFLRVALRSRAAAFVGGLAFVLTFWHTQQVLIMGRLPLSLFYGVLPLPFYAFERSRLPSARTPSVILGAGALALLVFIHPGYAAWASIFLSFYMALRLTGLCPGRRLQGRRCRRLVAAAALILGFGQVAGAFLWLPMWLERGSTGLVEGLSLAGRPVPDVWQLLDWSNFRVLLLPLPETSRHWYGGYLGLSLIVLAAAGVAGPVLTRRRVRRSMMPPCAAGLGLSLLLVLGYRAELLQHLALVQALNAGRYLLFVAFFLAALAGAGALQLMGEVRSAGGLRRGTVILLVMLMDLGPTTFQQPYITHRMQPPPLRLPGFRCVAITEEEHLPLALALLYWEKGVATPQGVFDESSISFRRFTEPFLSLAAPRIRSVASLQELGATAPGRVVLSGLRLLDVSQVYLFRQQRGRLMPVPSQVPGPVVVSARLDTFPGGALPAEARSRRRDMPKKEAWVASVIDGMSLSPRRGVSDRIYVRDVAPRDLGTSPRVVVRRQGEQNQRARLSLEVSAPCFARLAYSFHPHLAVTVDGQRAQTWESVGGFTVIELAEGRHEILLEPRLSPLRKGLAALDVGLLTGAAWILWRRRRRRIA